MGLISVCVRSLGEVKRVASGELPAVERSPRISDGAGGYLDCGHCFPPLHFRRCTNRVATLNFAAAHANRVGVTDVAFDGLTETKARFCAFFKISLKSIYRSTGASCQKRDERVIRTRSSSEACRIILFFLVLKRSFYWCLTLPRLPVSWMLLSSH